MAKVTDVRSAQRDKVVFICDYSPPRAGDPTYLEPVKNVDMDFICVAYNPAKSVRVNSIIAAYTIKRMLNKDVIFNLATRDMNKLALQSQLLGAQMLGLENVIVVQGDEFTERDLSLAKDVHDYTPTTLMQGIGIMNEGLDYKGLKFRSPTSFCIGATVDLAKEMEREARLTRQKVRAGAQFFITQPIFQGKEGKEFQETYRAVAGEELSSPVFYGLQILDKDGIVFGDVPESITQELNKGRAGTDIALEMLSDFVAAGIRNVYLIPPILKGGVRNYEAAQQVVESFKG